MKILILILTGFSAIAFGQAKRNLDWSTKDSLAVKNVNSILDYSKKSYFTSGTDIGAQSDINYNVNQLWINKNSFNTVNGGIYSDYAAPCTLLEPRLNTINTQIRTLMTIPVYKSK